MGHINKFRFLKNRTQTETRTRGYKESRFFRYLLPHDFSFALLTDESVTAIGYLSGSCRLMCHRDRLGVKDGQACRVVTRL